jgi:hypothetical protein
MTTILINSIVLAKLIEEEPKLKMDILNSALPQIAALMSKRFLADNVETKIGKAVAENLDRIRYGNMTVSQREGFQKIILDIWTKDMKERLEIDARRIAEEIAGQKIATMLEEVRTEIAQARDTAKAELDAYARTVAEREVLSLLRGGQLVAAHAAPS